ncbi:YbhB/YbcL family Raf kinase inhibitor-like protein [Dechloromonas sp. TW-R-39-2]|uniref:YbhB/YbcL family Raf kinase inhibitor-like protein n=1 Tax=Dechloromonas sp. TW-R-39-2 TaxID=2654218 RepID=UPI00193D0063|nr:YbhB/YbcL family Raf kinase inhibitor-like protein [Dechloromonas sp. TW-R-39-2]QRM20548.1 YbhB/YbcL family Raf kinase inhibitor-like protein [Dechloromonas sp. TW-R-39-2]
MKLTCTAFTDGQRIPGDFSFCIPDPAHHVCLGKNLNPPLAWDDVPEGTQSFVLICHDPDVPSKGDDVNQEGRTVPASLPRVDFFHWVLIDLPAAVNAISQGEFSNTVSPRGKPGPQAAHGTRQGINNYTDWFAGDNDMRGDYYGYDGPCPPWNDEIIHRYIFTLYALDVAHLPIEGRFGGPEVRQAIQGHILAEASLTGTYTLNPKL